MQSFSSFMNTIQFNFLYIDRYSFRRAWTYPESAIPYNMLRCIIDESAKLMADRETVIVRKGQVSCIPGGCRLSCRALEDTFAFYNIRFTAPVLYKKANFLKECYNLPLVMDMGEGIGPYFGDIYKWMRTDRKSKSFHVKGTLGTLIASLIGILNSDELDDMKTEINGLEYNLEQIRRRVKKSTIQINPRIRTVIDYIILNPTEEYTSDKLNGIAEMAEATFRRLFKETTGKTATEFIRQIRLTTVARLLLVSNDPVNCIVRDMGFEDANHFTRVFRQAFGMTPSRYREVSQEQRWGRDGNKEAKQGT